MPKLIFINLPVADLARSVAFYEAVGAKKNPMFSDETAACMVFSDTIHAMLLTHEKWVVDRAAKSGGQADPSAKQDYGFMYGRSYADPDGHIWEIMWMDPEAAAQGPEAFASQVGGG